MRNTQKILGFNVCTLNQEKIIDNLNKDIKSKKQNIIYNINPLIITNFYEQETVIKEFNTQKYNIPDGIGIVLASKLKRLNINKRIAGIDLFDNLMKLSNDNGYKVYFYGAKEEVVVKAKKQLEKKYRRIKIVGTTNGYVAEEHALKEILSKKIDILLIGLGSPKQEEFIIKHKKELKDIKVIMPVGGSFDVVSGELTRAPKIFIKLNLEWLYRMLKEPKRIKSIQKLIKFIFLVLLEKKDYNKRRKNGVK